MSDELKGTIGDRVDDQVFIAVMGATGSGKSTFINLASGSDLRISDGLESCTHAVDVSRAFELDSRQVVLIDTPGFDDTNRSDTEILDTIATFLGTSYKKGERLSGVIYIHRISDFRMGGSSSRNFKLFCNICGDDALQNGVIMTNMWGEVELKKGEAREAELKDKFFHPALEKDAKIFRHDDTKETAHKILRIVVQNKLLPLQLQTELDEGKSLLETVTGAELNRELLEAAQKQEAEIKKLQEEMEEAMRMKDEETRKELEEAKRELQEKVDNLKHDAKHLKSAHLKPQRATESLGLVDPPPEKLTKEPVLVQPAHLKSAHLKTQRATESLSLVEPLPMDEKLTKEPILVQPAENSQYRQGHLKSAYLEPQRAAGSLVLVGAPPKAEKVTKEPFVQPTHQRPVTLAQPFSSHHQSRHHELGQAHSEKRDQPAFSAEERRIVDVQQQPYHSQAPRKTVNQVSATLEPKAQPIYHSPEMGNRLGIGSKQDPELAVEVEQENWKSHQQKQKNLEQIIEELEDSRSGPNLMTKATNWWKGKPSGEDYPEAVDDDAGSGDIGHEGKKTKGGRMMGPFQSMSKSGGPGAIVPGCYSTGQKGKKTEGGSRLGRSQPY